MIRGIHVIYQNSFLLLCLLRFKRNIVFSVENMYYLRINFIIIFKIFIKLSTELAEIWSFNNIDICHAFNSLNVSYICDCLIRIRYCNVLKKHGFSGFGVFFATDCTVCFCETKSVFFLTVDFDMKCHVQLLIFQTKVIFFQLYYKCL